MIYTKEITIPANTPENSRQRNYLKVSAGILHEIEFQFPPGCENLVKTQVNLGGHPIFPSTEGQYIAGDTFPIAFKDHIKLKTGQNILGFLTFNEDGFYPHTIRIRVSILRGKDLAKLDSLAALGGVITGSGGSPSSTAKRRKL